MREENDLIRMAKSAPAATLLLALNILAYVLECILGAPKDLNVMVRMGANVVPEVLQGEVWRFLTCMFLHFDVKHLFSNMLGLFFMGGIMEQELGHARFTLLYFLSGIAASALSFLFCLLSQSYPVSAGASGAVFGIIGSMAMTMWKRRGNFRGMHPRNLAFMVFYSLFSGFTTSGIDNAAHVGGLAAGFLLTGLFR
ncbi:MAG: rhomboid family intramembrane serine protease [Lachnospiraceae bacterium]|nr:rhomboid family intramembrane serine protease [Lachnospiraceae bacterium]